MSESIRELPEYWRELADTADQPNRAEVLRVCAQELESRLEDKIIQTWDPEDHPPIGDCVVCDNPVYPANPDEKDAPSTAPVAHAACGW